MDIFEFMFLLVDIFYHPLQNYRNRKYKHITYEADVFASDVDKKYVAFDVAYDKARMQKAPLPIIVNIHGGGFVKGDKKHRHSLSKMYADLGYFVVNINHRLCPKHPFPTAIQDIFVQLKAIEDLQDKYNIDINKVVLTGDSAGAYYSTLAYACAKDKELSKSFELVENNLNMVGLMSFSGIYDCETAFTKKFKFIVPKLISDIIGTKVKKDFNEFKEYKHYYNMSPINHVNSNWDKVLVSYAKHDLFLAGQGEQFIAKLDELGLPYEEDNSVELTSNHCYHLLFYKKASKRCMQKVKEYLEEVTK